MTEMRDPNGKKFNVEDADVYNLIKQGWTTVKPITVLIIKDKK